MKTNDTSPEGLIEQAEWTILEKASAAEACASDLIEENRKELAELVPSLVAALKNVIEERNENEGIFRVWRRRCETAEATLDTLTAPEMHKSLWRITQDAQKAHDVLNLLRKLSGKD